MSDYIKDTSGKKTERTSLDIAHFDKFSEYPFVIGVFWNDAEQLKMNIIEAIEIGKPYNEYELLSEEQKDGFDNGTLYF